MNRKKTGIWMLLLVLTFWITLSGTAGAASFSRKAPVVKAKKQATSVTLKWSRRSDLTGYQVYRTNAAGGNKRLQKSTTGNSVTLHRLKRGKTYYYRVRGYKKSNGRITYTKFSKVAEVKISKTAQTSTLKELLKTGLQPVGRTMYVWGGGWNKADTGAGDAARSIGVSPKWEAFFHRQNSSYNYQNTRYQIENGLDCSGYIGWCVYNILNTKDGKPGYVMLAQNMARSFASYGWGTYLPKSQVKDYRAGDIMSSSGHVWMAVGQCSDGSVVLLHSSPPGVQLAGTPASDGSRDSRAVELAEYYMKKYYPEWYSKYPNCAKDASYLTSYAQMRWDISGKAVMTDPDHYRNMSADEILKDLFA
ncbi:MAG TPA: fibronectin type III domain-containing protein [Candidatus Choladousia intestinipullorum]|nr:fibronectin type III domain-containing protein [Candidatus Choladousia intestinipullorum]